MIRIITTGGTFDKLYDEINGELTFKGSQLNRIVKQSRINVPVQIESILAVDSLVMTDEQREHVVETSFACEEDKVIIIHGTDTIVKTALILKEKAIDKTIVLTGAMIPYSLENSDALFNLGCAITSVQLLNHGVYITMGGNIFLADDVVKNKALGVFERLSK